MKLHYYIGLLLTLMISYSCSKTHSKTYLYLGSYTSEKKAEGIVVYDFNTDSGTLTEIEKKANLINPSFLTISKNGKFLYACTETRLEKHGSVSAFKIDSLTGKITFLNKQTTNGRNPVHVVVDHTSKYVIASNYTDAGLSVFQCKPDGSLIPALQHFTFKGSSLIKGRQDAAHLHSSTFSPDNKYLFAPDLGSDKIRAFTFDLNKRLTISDTLTVNTAKGAGPRHFTFHPNKPFAFSVEELTGAVSVYKYKNGQLSLNKTYKSYKNEQDHYKSADIHVSPDGKHLYISNRDEEHSISIFSIDLNTGTLSLEGHQSTYGKTPRSFVIDPTGNYLIVANKTSNNIVVFKRNINTGLLTKLTIRESIPMPASLKMVTYENDF